MHFLLFWKKQTLFIFFSFLFPFSINAQYLGYSAQSWEVINDSAPVFKEPAYSQNRLGTLARGSRLKVYAWINGPHCTGKKWAQIAANQYLCGQHLKASSLPPEVKLFPQLKKNQLLPKKYAFVAYDGAPGYAQISDYFTGEYAITFGKGFGLNIISKETVDGVRFYKTKNGYWIDSASIHFARGSSFSGFKIKDGNLNFAWTKKNKTKIYNSSHKKVVAQLEKRTLIKIISQNEKWIQTEKGFIKKNFLHLPELTSKPKNIKENEIWIDISIASQILILYRGHVPFYATLVSTGKKHKKRETPLGQHRIWVKLAFSDMNNLQLDYLESNYAIEDVPWVQYFKGSNGLHAAFWHDQFGTRKSHGCVNLSPKDAKYIFEQTSPQLPAGWKAIFSTSENQGSLLNIRP